MDKNDRHTGEILHNLLLFTGLLLFCIDQNFYGCLSDSSTTIYNQTLDLQKILKTIISISFHTKTYALTLKKLDGRHSERGQVPLLYLVFSFTVFSLLIVFFSFPILRFCNSLLSPNRTHNYISGSQNTTIYRKTLNINHLNK